MIQCRSDRANRPKKQKTRRTARRRARGVLAGFALATGALVVPISSPLTNDPVEAYDACPSFRTWQDWLGGARVHASVSFRASDLCNGRHVRRAYVNIIRECGPYKELGRTYTNTATSEWDSTKRSVSAWMFDSVLWRCVTRTYYGWEYFGSGGGGGGGSGW